MLFVYGKTNFCGESSSSHTWKALNNYLQTVVSSLLIYGKKRRFL